jgi:hypothetical protein
MLIDGDVPAQQVVSARSGIIQYIEGNVFLEEKPLHLSRNSYAQMGEGGILRTGRGRVELLLGSGTYCRMGEDSSLRLKPIAGAGTRAVLDRGSLLVEVEKPQRGTGNGERFFRTGDRRSMESRSED